MIREGYLTLPRSRVHVKTQCRLASASSHQALLLLRSFSSIVNNVKVPVKASRGQTVFCLVQRPNAATALNRRAFLTAGTLTALGLTEDRLARLRADPANSGPTRRKSCVFFF